MHTLRKVSLSKFLILLFFCLTELNLHGQLQGHFLFDTFSIPNWPRIHSFAYASTGDKVLMVGGRKDGIHGKESGFDFDNSNRTIYLWNTKNHSIRAYPLAGLSAELQNFLSAANACFTQDDTFLYILGGYGQGSDSIYTSYPVFMRIHLQKCIDAVENGSDLMPAIQLIRDPYFAVAGGQLRIKDSLCYLAGGHVFKGIYSSNSSKVDQLYTDEVRIFKITGDSATLSFEKIHTLKNDYNFHRRDFNMNPIVDANGKIRLMVYSGVFQYNVNRPFLNVALLDALQFEEIFDFDQKFAAYNCSRIGFYEVQKNRMHQLFLGGMAEYFRDSSGTLVQDTYVPFVRSLSCVTRNEKGGFEEFLLNDELPGYYGTNAEVFVRAEIPRYKEDIIDLDAIQEDTSFIGYVFGGIYNPSPDRNPWLNNLAHTTSASNQLIRIRYLKNQSTGVEPIQNKKIQADIRIYPNPAGNATKVFLIGTAESSRVHIWIQDMDGIIVDEEDYTSLSGEGHTLNLKSIHSGNYHLYALLDGSVLLKTKLQVLKNE